MGEPTLRLLDGLPGDGHGGEIYAVSYSSDSAFVLSGAWDGQLKLWETVGGSPVTGLRVSDKPLSACAIAPDNHTWYAGSMDGMLTSWDASSHTQRLNFLAHTRPVSSIRFSSDGAMLATAAWDKQVSLRKAGKEREPKNLIGHGDIVASSAFTPDGQHLLSWSYDGSVILWNVADASKAWATPGHGDRVQAGSIGPDGKWAVTGSRDGQLKLWDLTKRTEAAAITIKGEVRGCWLLLDGESLAVATADGWLGVLSVPDFTVRTELLADLRVECSALSPSGSQLALGCSDGRVHFVAVDGLEQATLVVTATQSIQQQEPTMLSRLFGKKQSTRVFQYVCPACQFAAVSAHLPQQPVLCSKCRRKLRVNGQVAQLQKQ